MEASYSTWSFKKYVSIVFDQTLSYVCDNAAQFQLARFQNFLICSPLIHNQSVLCNSSSNFNIHFINFRFCFDTMQLNYLCLKPKGYTYGVIWFILNIWLFEIPFLLTNPFCDMKASWVMDNICMQYMYPFFHVDWCWFKADFR